MSSKACCTGQMVTDPRSFCGRMQSLLKWQQLRRMSSGPGFTSTSSCPIRSSSYPFWIWYELGHHPLFHERRIVDMAVKTAGSISARNTCMETGWSCLLWDMSWFTVSGTLLISSLTPQRYGTQPVVTSAVDFFFGKTEARVPPSASFHERLADLLLTSFSFAAEDPGGAPHLVHTNLNLIRQACADLPLASFPAATLVSCVYPPRSPLKSR